MAAPVDEIDPRILYATMFVIIILGIVINLDLSDISSIIALYLIIIIALGNIGYIYSKYSKP